MVHLPAVSLMTTNTETRTNKQKHPMYNIIDNNLASNALNFTSDLIGFIMIWQAINHKRNEDCMIKLFTKDWFFLVILVITASFFLTQTPTPCTP